MLNCIFDTETSDLIKNSVIPVGKKPRMIEFCGVLATDDGEIVDELDLLIDPGITISATITKVTGIKPGDLAGQPKIEDVIDRIAKFIGRADRIIAHNLAFDKSILVTEVERIGFSIFGYEEFWPKNEICTVEASLHYLGYRLSLQVLHRHLFNEGFTGAHRAKTDVAALIRCFFEMKKRGDVL